MTGSDVGHMDVGAYALGVLSDWEATQFEAHLAGCDACARELEELTSVSALLSHVDVDSLTAVEQYDRDGRALDRMLNVVSLERRRTRTRRVLASAAAVVMVIAGLAFGLTGFTQLKGDSGGQQGIASPGPGKDFTIQGTKPTYAQKKDDLSGATASLTMRESRWGTAVNLKLTGVQGPKRCELVAIGKDGTSTTVNGWFVDKRGYGQMAQPEPLNIDGTTYLKRSELDRFEVRVVGQQTPLVSVPVAT
jgi:hypothetical protein